jgi:hypothetical protein
MDATFLQAKKKTSICWSFLIGSGGRDLFSADESNWVILFVIEVVLWIEIVNFAGLSRWLHICFGRLTFP